jgi:N-acetylmuramoyl-L-alanine amidase
VKRISFALVLTALLLTTASAPVQATVAGHVIIIDAGHGGTDPGSDACPTLLEKDANLGIAEKLQLKLNGSGAMAILTREGDETMSAADRYTKANSIPGAEILVSIHFNGSTDPTINYTQGLYSKWRKDMDLANALHKPLLKLPGVTDGGLSQFAAGVILKAEMPATIQEVSFISNPLECALLSDSTGTRQKQIVDLLYEGIDNWFSTTIKPSKPGNR